MASLTNIQQNLIPVEPDLIDLLVQHKKDIMLNLNCHHIGTVQVFNPLLQTASATINYQKTFFQFNNLTGQYQPMPGSYTVIAEAPVICLGGGSGALTFPIKSGDECLVLFNDRDLDNWFTGGTGSPNATARLHSYSDAIILVGLRSIPNILLNYDTTRVVLRNGIGGTTMVGVGPSLVKIANVTTTLNTLLQSLITDIETLVTQTALINVSSFGAPPNNAAAITAVKASLIALGAQISGLLE